MSNELENMSEQNVKLLAEKIKNETATPEEEVLFIDILNAGVKSLTEVIKNIPQE